MFKTTFIIFFLSWTSISFSQRRGRSSENENLSEKSRSLIGFYNKIRYSALLANFSSKNAPSIGVGSEDGKFKTPDDTSSITDPLPPYKNQTHILEFVGHPVFSDSVKGRLEMFTSVCWDGSCVHEVSSKLFFDFKTETDARVFIRNLFDSLTPLSDTLWHTKIEEIEKYEFASDLRPDRYEPDLLRYWQYISLTLSRRKNSGGFQIQIDDH